VEVYYELQRNDKYIRTNANENHEYFAMGLISFEKEINDKDDLVKLD
jgi:hypothetical protein